MCEPTTIAMVAVAVVGAVYGYQQQKSATEQMAKEQQRQIDAQAAEKTNQRMEEARALRAQMRASAAESAVSGNSVNILLDDVMGQAGRDAALIENNRKTGVMASQSEANARIRIAQAEAFRDISGAGVSAYSNYQQYKINS